MPRTDLSSVLRRLVRDHLTLTESERAMVSAIYHAVADAVGANACIQIGSFARFTAVRPPHDIDLLFVAGVWTGQAQDPSRLLGQVREAIDRYLATSNPTPFAIRVETQTHSVSVSFTDAGREVFAVDVVPAFEHSLNEFREPCYFVPEVAALGHSARRRLYAEYRKSARAVGWIRTDPRGYTTVASRLNSANDDFRRAVKFLKGWRNECRRRAGEFRLKSFHIEQLVSRIFRESPTITIAEAVVQVLRAIPSALSQPQIPDRAEETRFIDEYVATMSAAQKEAIKSAAAELLRVLDGTEAESELAAIVGIAPRAAAPLARKAPTVIAAPPRPWRA